MHDSCQETGDEVTLSVAWLIKKGGRADDCKFPIDDIMAANRPNFNFAFKF